MGHSARPHGRLRDLLLAAWFVVQFAGFQEFWHWQPQKHAESVPAACLKVGKLLLMVGDSSHCLYDTLSQKTASTVHVENGTRMRYWSR